MVKYRSPKLIQKRRKRLFLRVFFCVIAIIAFFLFTSELSKVNFLNIKKIKIIGNKTINKVFILDIVSKKISGNYLGLYSRQNFLLYPKWSITSDILTRFPKIKSLTLKVKVPNTLEVILIERKPYVLWVVDDVKKQKYFFADKEGYAFNKASTSAVKNFFEYYTLDNKGSIKQFILGKSKFKKIDSFVRFVRRYNLHPYKFVADGKKYEIYYGKNSRLIFDASQNIKDVMNNFRSVLNIAEFSSKKNLMNVDYIDLRFGNKVFYKDK